MQLIFDSGALWSNGIEPVQFGTLQDVLVDWNWTAKELRDQSQFVISIAHGLGKITSKARIARISRAVFADVFFDQLAAAAATPFTPIFRATLYVTKALHSTEPALTLNACSSTKLSLIPIGPNDYEIEEFDFAAFADSAGNIGTLHAGTAT